MTAAAVAGDGLVVTLAAARAHLKAGDELADVDLAPVEMGRPLIGEGGWATAADVPANVVHAVKLVLTDLFENRLTPLSDITGVRRLIGRYIAIAFG